MSAILKELNKILPEKIHIPLRNEADCYGMSRIISKSLHLPFTPRSFGNWLHGWCHNELKYIEQFGIEDNEIYLVHNLSQEKFFKARHKNAIAVGAPFIYAHLSDSLAVERRKGSLLVMPPHGLDFSKETLKTKDYVASIVKLKEQFSDILVCLHPATVAKGHWYNEFETAHIPCISGAEMSDMNGLVRMVRLFRFFEYMTTNVIGSHVAYASYCGCKVSIFGEYFNWQKEFLEDDPLFIEYPHLLQHTVEELSEKNVRAKYNFLFTHPLKAQINTEWAQEELGLSHKKAPLLLAFYLSWFPHSQSFQWIKKLRNRLILICRELT